MLLSITSAYMVFVANYREHGMSAEFNAGTSISVPNIIYYRTFTFVFFIVTEMSIERFFFCIRSSPSLSFIPATDMFNVIDRLWFIYRIKFMPSFIRRK